MIGLCSTLHSSRAVFNNGIGAPFPFSQRGPYKQVFYKGLAVSESPPCSFSGVFWGFFSQESVPSTLLLWVLSVLKDQIPPFYTFSFFFPG